MEMETLFISIFGLTQTTNNADNCSPLETQTLPRSSDELSQA